MAAVIVSSGRKLSSVHREGLRHDLHAHRASLARHLIEQREEIV